MSPQKEKNLVLAPGDLYKDNKNKLFKNNLYYTRKNQKFILTKTNKIKYMISSTNQLISIGTGLIPFLEHDDANRVLMGSNMQRQALPIIKKEMPLVETGMELEIAKESQSTLIAKKSGIVIYKSIKRIIIKEIIGKTNYFLNKTKSIKEKTKNKLPKKRGKYKTNQYTIENTRKSNQNSYLQQIPNKSRGEWIKKGEIIADGNATIQGKLSLGCNLLICYMSWEGYNFEDAIIINEKLAKNDTLSSLHIKKYKTYLTKTDDEEVRISDRWWKQK